MKNEKIYLIEWDGTVERYNEIVELLFPIEKYQINFLDENYNITNKFTNIFSTFSFEKNMPNSNMVFKKGSFLNYTITEEK